MIEASLIDLKVWKALMHSLTISTGSISYLFAHRDSWPRATVMLDEGCTGDVFQVFAAACGRRMHRRTYSSISRNDSMILRMAIGSAGET